MVETAVAETTVAETAVAETAVAHREPAASETATAKAVTSETATAKAVTSAAKTTTMASAATTASTAAPCERTSVKVVIDNVWPTVPVPVPEQPYSLGFFVWNDVVSINSTAAIDIVLNHHGIVGLVPRFGNLLRLAIFLRRRFAILLEKPISLSSKKSLYVINRNRKI